MKGAREIADAKTRLGNMRGTCHLETSLVDRCFPIYKANSTDYRDEAAFQVDLGHPFLNYSFSDAEGGAEEAAFVVAFDKHVALQEEN